MITIKLTIVSESLGTKLYYAGGNWNIHNYTNGWFQIIHGQKKLSCSLWSQCWT